jgi:hypothetical protein
MSNIDQQAGGTLGHIGPITGSLWQLAGDRESGNAPALTKGKHRVPDSTILDRN